MDKKTTLLLTAKSLLNTQKKRLFIIITLIVTVIGGLSVNFIIRQHTKKPPTLNEVSKKAPVYDVTKEISDRNYWMHQAESELKKNLRDAQSAQQKADKLEERLNKLEQNKTTPSSSDNQALQELLTRLRAVEEKLTNNSTTGTANAEDPSVLSGEKEHANSDRALQKPEQWQRPMANMPRKHLPIHLNLNNLKKSSQFSPNQKEEVGQNASFSQAPSAMALTPKPTITTDHFQPNLQAKNYLELKNFVLSGTFIRGILLNGMDVSTGEAARVNPTHVAIQLIEPGNLPNYRDGQFKHCVVLGAAHGDKSSERAKVRLERLTCVWNVAGEDVGVSTDVFGYIVGVDGKEGIRGKMIKRDKEAMTKAFWAKFIGGMGNLLSQGAGQQSITPQGNMLRTFDNKELIKGGLMSGAGGAFDLLSQMAIKEIDKLSDIIQIHGGQAVDLVFVEDTELTTKRGSSSKNQANTQVNHINQVFE